MLGLCYNSVIKLKAKEGNLMTVETANRLYELRKKHDLSQEELAEKLGVSRQAVSKWERSEASPDTDNLIALAKIYGLSLDELIYGEKSEKQERSDQPSEKQDEETEEKPSEEPLFTVEDKKSKVQIGPTSVVVEDEDGETVKIGLSGIRIESAKSHEDSEDAFDLSLDPEIVVDNNGHIKINVQKKENKKVKFWLQVPYPIICVIAYLIFGIYNIYGGWALSWIVFVTIPIYYSLVEAIYDRKLSNFAYPVLTALIYLYFGLYHGNWHPSWIVFLTIPVYSPIAEALDRKIKLKKENTK